MAPLFQYETKNGWAWGNHIRVKLGVRLYDMELWVEGCDHGASWTIGVDLDTILSISVYLESAMVISANMKQGGTGMVSTPTLKSVRFKITKVKMEIRGCVPESPLWRHVYPKLNRAGEINYPRAIGPLVSSVLGPLAETIAMYSISNLV